MTPRSVNAAYEARSLAELELNLAQELDHLKQTDLFFYNKKIEQIELIAITHRSVEQEQQLQHIAKELEAFATSEENKANYQYHIQTCDEKINSIQREIARKNALKKTEEARRTRTPAWLDVAFMEPVIRQVTNLFIKITSMLQKTYQQIPGLNTAASIFRNVLSGMGGLIMAFAAPIYYGITAAWDILRAVVDNTIPKRTTRAIAAVATAGLATLGLLALGGVITLGALPAAVVGAGFYIVGYIKERRITAHIKNELEKEIKNNSDIKIKLSGATIANHIHEMSTLKRHLQQSDEKLKTLKTQLNQARIKRSVQKRSLAFALGVIAGFALLAIFPPLAPLGIALIVGGAIGIAGSTGLYVRDIRASTRVIATSQAQAKNASSELDSKHSIQNHHVPLESEAKTFEKLAGNKVSEATHLAEEAEHTSHAIHIISEQKKRKPLDSEATKPAPVPEEKASFKSDEGETPPHFSEKR